MTDSKTSIDTSPSNPVPLRLAEGPVVYVPHEELSLVDVAVVLVRRWFWVVGGIAVGLGCSTWWIASSPVKYESRGVIRIGRSRASFPIKPTKEQQDMLLEPVSVASMRIREEYSAASELSRQFDGAAVSTTVFDREADELLTVFARAPDPGSAQNFLNAVMQDFVKGHQKLFAPEREVMTGRLKAIAEERERIGKELTRLEEPNSEAGNSESAAPLTALRQLTRSQFLQQGLSLEQEAVRLQRDMIDLQSQPTTLLSAATRSSAPVEPRKTFLVLLGGLFGILLGCGMAFFVEFAVQVFRRLRGPTCDS